MARISTHVLDIAKGTPAAGITVELYAAGHLIRSATTNSDGRTDTPMLAADRIPPGPYELIFHVEQRFYDRITIRFLVSDEEANYHVPLLLAPHGYSTYRGS
jgi:5-hydroxyisourate hydrolase